MNKNLALRLTGLTLIVVVVSSCGSSSEGDADTATSTSSTTSPPTTTTTLATTTSTTAAPTTTTTAAPTTTSTAPQVSGTVTMVFGDHVLIADVEVCPVGILAAGGYWSHPGGNNRAPAESSDGSTWEIS